MRHILYSYKYRTENIAKDFIFQIYGTVGYSAGQCPAQWRTVEYSESQ